MSSEDLNREQKRALKRMGALNEQGNPTRTQPQARVKSHGEPRTGPVTYLREVNDEMKKVAWPNGLKCAGIPSLFSSLLWSSRHMLVALMRFSAFSLVGSTRNNDE